MFSLAYWVARLTNEAALLQLVLQLLRQAGNALKLRPCFGVPQSHPHVLEESQDIRAQSFRHSCEDRSEYGFVADVKLVFDHGSALGAAELGDHLVYDFK